MKELIDYRDLLFTLTYRDLRVQYAQTAIGFAWAFINPIFQIVILSFIFGTVAKVGTGDSNVPHLLYTAAGMCGWTYFAKVFTDAGKSIIGAQGMVTKIYFPRIIIPLSKAITAFVDLFVALLIVFVLIIYYQISFSTSIFYLPLFIFVAVISGLTGGIWMSALTIRYRDFVQINPLLIRLGMYATPIAYPADQVPESYQILFYLNPMAGVVEGMRWSLIGGSPPVLYAYISFIVIIVLFIVGVFYFNLIERKIADII